MQPFGQFPAKESPPASVTSLLEQVESDGGHVLAVYREPVGKNWQAFCLLPLERVAPTPYQRDLSPTHAERLTEVVKKVDRVVDPSVVVSPEPGVYWTPNGHHRRTALEKLKAKLVPAILVPEAEVAYQILALNTEKAHNLKEKSLEVIRMYRGLAEARPKTGEKDWEFQFEAAHYVTLGLVYEENRRFAGGAFSPMLKRVDGFLKGRLPETLVKREERAEKVKAADAALQEVVAALKKKGINHPYVKNFVLARTSPLTRARKTLPSFDQAFDKLVARLQEFDAEGVRSSDIQKAAAFAGPAAD